MIPSKPSVISQKDRQRMDSQFRRLANQLSNIHQTPPPPHIPHHSQFMDAKLSRTGGFLPQSTPIAKGPLKIPTEIRPIYQQQAIQHQTAHNTRDVSPPTPQSGIMFGIPPWIIVGLVLGLLGAVMVSTVILLPAALRRDPTVPSFAVHRQDEPKGSAHDTTT